MGCDGGTIPRRDELVRLKKKPEKKDKDAEIAAKWKLCALTQQPLQRPIVACEMGSLYNKDSVIELLLDQSKFEGATKFSHIRGLKDVKELQLTENPDYKGKQDKKGDTTLDRQAAEFICPVTGIEMRGVYKFMYLRDCGCVFSDRAMKEVKTDMCHKCGKQFKPDDMITLNPAEEEVEQQRAQMERRRLQAKLDKKAKKKKAESTITSATENGVSEGPSTSKKARTDADAAGTSKPKIGKLINGAAGATGGKTGGEKGEKAAKKSKSLQDDPTASKAYKSLFTSCEKAKSQPKAHWVTYNPCFY